MVRTELREHIFKMLFQIEFNDSVDMPENLNYYFETLEDAKEKDKNEQSRSVNFTVGALRDKMG